jgi:ABC-type bacteriocin/lantibiotic exporter with double-glycine peptidase domain
MLFVLPPVLPHTFFYSTPLAVLSPVTTKKSEVALTLIPQVPFYSQFTDITSSKWKKVGCGVASLAMIVNYYKPGTVTVNRLLEQAVAAGAYDHAAGWTYSGLIGVSKKYGLSGTVHDLSVRSSSAALAEFKTALGAGPVIASVHYKFDPKSTIPHLVVINGIKDNTLYYNDPAAKTGEKQISVTDFLRGWKQRFIVLRPLNTDGGAVVAISLN